MDFLTQYFRNLVSWFNLYILKKKIKKKSSFSEKIKFFAVPSGGTGSVLISNVIRICDKKNIIKKNDQRKMTLRQRESKNLCLM